MEAVRESWTDERLDNFRERVEERFDNVDRRFDSVDRRLDNVDRRLDRVEDRLDSIQRAMIYGTVAISGSIVAGFVGVIGLVATQL
jgi:archaellum component FlaC